jgi:hypothetical protein
MKEVGRDCGRRNSGRMQVEDEGRYCFGVWNGLSSEVRLVGLQHRKLADTLVHGADTVLLSRRGIEE